MGPLQLDMNRIPISTRWTNVDFIRRRRRRRASFD
jgi:hypothetical protein